PGLKQEWKRLATRRHFLGGSGKLLALAGLASLMPGGLAGISAAVASEKSGGALGAPHFAPRAKRAIHLTVPGGAPEMDLGDYKPGLQEGFDRDLRETVRGTTMPTGMTAGQARFPVAPSHWNFKQYGHCRRWVSDLLPQTAKLSDDIAV